jgi:HSP20 family protein
MNTRLMKTEFPFLRHLNRDFDWFFDAFAKEKPFVETALWTPDLEVFEAGNELVVRADVPGLKREDIKVEITDFELTIAGERKVEKEENEKGVYRSERSYGTFFRAIALPDGAKADLAKATVKDGVLEVKMPLARIESARRRLDITDGPAGEKISKHAA